MVSIPEKPDPDPFSLRDEPLAPARRARGTDSSAVWAAVLLIGATAGAYAVLRAARTEAPARSVPVAAPGPARPPAARPRLARPAPVRPPEAIAKTSAPA